MRDKTDKRELFAVRYLCMGMLAALLVINLIPNKMITIYAAEYQEQQEQIEDSTGEDAIPSAITFENRCLQKSIQGVMITVEGNMPSDAELEVSAEPLSAREQEKLRSESELMDAENICYSYDISILYCGVEYEPHLFDEKMKVTFSFADDEKLKNVTDMEVFHIDDEEKVEKIEIKEATKQEVSFSADAFSKYILITKLEYTEQKSWSYGFTGDIQTFTAPVSGQYMFECYGAGISNSKGSFAKGTIGLKKDETVYIYVGGQNNTFNGGGKGGAVWHSASNSGGSFSQNVYSDNGCGATDVRVGLDTESRLIVAGGGGGNGHEGGVNYSYNGFDVSDGPGYSNVYAINQVLSNEVLRTGSDYSTYVNSGDWGSGDYPNHGTYSMRVVTGGGGGGFYGGKSGYAGTSKVIPQLEYQGKTYQAVDSVVETLTYVGNGKCEVSLYAMEADVITYYNYNMAKLGEAAGLTGTTVSFPAMTAAPYRESDSQYDYTYLGWDDMETEEIEHYTDEETVAAALQGSRNYIAAYESTGKKYEVILDHGNAQHAGTTGMIATFHAPLPDIEIPVKEGAVFAGYYEARNGGGKQIYSAAGKAVSLSEFAQNSVIYAHWVQPITELKKPEDREVLAGYAGVVFSTQAQLIQQTGYALSYQWYTSLEENVQSGTPVELADGRRLVVPQGLQPGNYYFYCVVTATNVLNGQSVSAVTSPALLQVEKGVMGMEFVEVETPEIIYDGTPKELKIAINTSNPYTVYYGTEPLREENYRTKGVTKPYSYTDAGTYTNHIYVTGVDFADFYGSISMTIHKAESQVYLPSKNTTYNGQIQTIDPAQVYDVRDQKMEGLVAYVYFLDEACTKKTDQSCGALTEGGAPSAVGTYYVHAVTGETVNYHDVATKNPSMFNILGINTRYSISGYHGKYDGQPHGLQITCEDKENTMIYFSDQIELTQDNYQTAGTLEPYRYTQTGEYPVYYLVASKLAGGIWEYDKGMAKIIIETAKTAEENIYPADDDHKEQNAEQDATDQAHTNSNAETEKTHKHVYELLDFEKPTADAEGKAVYHCSICEKELVITYPAQKQAELEKEQNDSDRKTQEMVTEKGDVASSQLSKKETNKTTEEKETVALTKAETTDTEKELSDEVIEILSNVTAEELTSLLELVRKPVVIETEHVALTEEVETQDVDDENELVEQEELQQLNMWKPLSIFLFGVIVVLTVSRMLERSRKTGTQKK